MDEEFQQDTVPETIDDRPLLERIADKNWKTRNTAYEELKSSLEANTIDENSLTDYGPYLAKMTADVNAGAMDTGFETAVAFVGMAPLSASLQFSDALLKNSVEKAFNARPSTVAKGKSLLLKMMEVDEPTLCTNYLMSKMTDKKPKVPGTCLDVIREGMVLFGVRVFPVKEIIKGLKPVFDGSNASAKEAALNLIVEIYRWIGVAPLQALLDSIKPVQKAEFEKTIADKDDDFRAQAVPTLYLRKNRPLPGSTTSDETSVSAKSSVAKGTSGIASGREYVDDVDLPKKLRSTDFATLVADEKWSEQLKGLQLVIDAIGPVPKIKAGSDVHDIVSVCKGFLRQGHVLLQVSSLKILALLADGLRSEFSSTIRPMLQTVLQKSKEKKLLHDVQNCLHTVLMYCVNFDSLTEEVTELIRNKKNPPHCKICVMEFLCTVLCEMPEKVSSDSMKPLAEALLCVCEDPDPKVRDACSVALGTLWQTVKSRGKPALDANRVLLALEQSAPRVFKKMQTAMELPSSSSSKATATLSSTLPTPSNEETVSMSASSGQLKAKTGIAVPVKKPAATAATGVKSTTLSSTTGAIKKSSASGLSSTSSGVSSKKGMAKEGDDDNVEDLSLSADEAQSILEGLGVEGWDSTLQTNMVSSKWQDKVDALGAIERRIVETNTGGLYSAALVKYLSEKTSGFKISNANILKAVIQTTCAAVTHCGDSKFNKSAAWELLKQFGDKLSDRKTKEVVETLLTALSENISPGFVVKRMRVVMDKIKSPIAHQYFLEWLKQAVHDFGYGVFPVSQIGAFCQLEMENKIAAVRSAAVEVMGALYHQIGPKLLVIAISDDMKPALKSLLEAEFAKVGHDPSAATKATRAVMGEDGAVAGEAIPRQDLCQLVDKNILNELNLLEGKTSWMNRKTAMETIIAACERSGHFLDATKATGEIVKALKVRINDTQANLKPIAVSAIGHVIASLEVDKANKVLKIVAEGMLSGLADNKKTMRDATVAALHLAVTQNRQPQEEQLADPVMLISLLPSICESLVNVVGRQELLEWLLRNIESLKTDCGDLTVSLVLSLQDKTAVVRTLAEQILTYLMSHSVVSKVQLDKATRDLPPATKRGLDKTIVALMSCYGTAVLASSSLAKKASSVPMSTATQDISMKTAAEDEEKHNAITSGVSASQRNVEVHNEIMPPKRSGLMMPRAGLSKTAVVGTSTAAGGGGSAASQALHTESESEYIAERADDDDDDGADNDVRGGFEGKWFLLRADGNRTRRLEEWSQLMWPEPPQETTEDDMLQLQTQWKPFMTSDLAYLIFPNTQYSLQKNQDTYVPAIIELNAQMDCPHFGQHVDFILRWCCIVLCSSECSTNGLPKLLSLVTAVFKYVHSDGAMLHESEAKSIVPYLIDKCGHSSEPIRDAFINAIDAASEIISPNKLSVFLIKGVQSVNKRSRVLSIQQMKKLIESAGVAALGRTMMHEIGQYLDSKNCDIAGRNACLDLISSAYSLTGNDQAKLDRLLGPLSERTMSLVNEKISGTKRNIDSVQSTHNEDKALRQQIERVMNTTTSEHQLSSESGRLFSSPPSKSRSSMIPVASPAVDEVESLYADILRRIDRLLTTSNVLSDNDAVHEEAKDYLKMLHSVVSGDWSSPDEHFVEDDAVLIRHSDRLVRQLVQCVARSFDRPAVMLNKVPGTFLGVDVSLLAISLSTLFAMVKRPDIAHNISEDTMFDVFYECLLRLCEPRILHPITSDTDSVQTAHQIVTAINMIVVKMASEGYTSSVLNVLLRVMFQCIPTSEVSLHVAKNRKDVNPLPSACTKPTSRLVIKVLTDETEKETPYGDSHFDLKSVLRTIHQFFSQHPANTTDDTPFRTVKTVLNEIIKARGGQTVLSTLQECEEIGLTAFIYLLTSRLGNVNLVTENDGELHAKIVAVIEEITAVRDKTVPIRQLHKLKMANPSLDFNVYLNQISSTFRRFVLDTLARLDAGDNAFQDENDSVEHNSTVQQLNDSNNKGAGTQNKADEAMRILEGLKNRPSYYKQLHSSTAVDKTPEDSSGGRLSSSFSPRPDSVGSSSRKSMDSPFAKRNDKIRDSLSSLTASLDLPQSTNSSNSNDSGLQTSSSSSVFDSDLQARLQRLRNMDLKS